MIFLTEIVTFKIKNLIIFSKRPFEKIDFYAPIFLGATPHGLKRTNNEENLFFVLTKCERAISEILPISRKSVFWL